MLTGKRDDRPQYQALLAEVRRLRADGQSVAVIVARLDRLGRRVLERVRCREELRILGVPTHSIREGGEVSDLVANVLAAVAQEEVERIGARVSETKQHLAEAGWRSGGSPPWGYRLRPATAEERAGGAPKVVLEPDPVTSPSLREAWRRLAEGETLRTVGRWIAELPNESRGYRVMGWQAVRMLFTRSVYVGRRDVGVGDVLDRPRAHWEPLIDDETWRRAQANIASHARLAHQASGRYLLSGLARCPRCGLGMVGASKARYGRANRYRCPGTKRGASSHDLGCQTEATVSQVDQAVLDQVAPLLELAATTGGLRSDLRRAWQQLQPAGRVDDVESRRRSLEAKLTKLTQRLAKAATLLVDGDLDKAGYGVMRDQTQREIATVEAELTNLPHARPETTLPNLDAVLARAGAISDALRSGDVADQRRVLAEVIERITPVRLGWGRYTAEVHWTPLGSALWQVATELHGKRIA
ncbi:MAG: recombinase family protein [Chloroflexi bacterium]|nr:recombinase family protein [Chloroflexota bacterium]